MTSTQRPPGDPGTAEPEPEPEPYDAAAVEARRQHRWEEAAANRTDLDAPVHPFYNLMMFPYPSAEGLHLGNCYAFTGADAYGRYRRLKGDDVFEPMGFDAFGIHSENYAIKVGEHPASLTRRTIANFRVQLKRLGGMFDWAHEVRTTDPAYYRWTQWIFLRLFDAGLAEQKEGAVNWCPSCKTVLADEQVVDGRCERCDSPVEKRVLKQWYLRITAYAQQLLDALDGLDWSEKTKLAQRNWIGRSEGATIVFDLEGCARTDVTVFTTRPDTLYGATFLVVGADHPHLDDFVAGDRREAVAAWRRDLPHAGAEPDFSVGISLGSSAVHPLTGDPLPVWAAPYVLGGYGTGAIMAVPAHDDRDWQFAREHGLPIVDVVSGGAADRDGAYTGTGALVASGDLDGLASDEGGRRIVERLAAEGRGEATVQFRLRDWLISRQRYWGPPIPIVHCPVDGAVRVPDADLPVLLPEIEEFRPLGTGTSPLASVEEWVNTTCPRCGGPARRETDVSDTFLDSAWYFLRYPSTDFDDVPFDRERTWRWLPVDMYIGGNEHAVLHLLYSRFVMRALFDLGLVPEPEPYRRFRAHGMIIKGGAKMSKSRGNVVNPDEYLDRYGADTLRLYLLALGAYSDGGDWSDAGIRGQARFLDRVWRVAHRPAGDADAADDRTRERRRHRVARAVDERTGELRYNTAISQLMELSRELEADGQAGALRRVDVETLLQLLAPFAPHIADELWERTGHSEPILESGYPRWDAELASADEVTVVVQENGTRRADFTAPRGTPRDELEATALALPRVRELLGGREPRRIVVVPDRIVNIVV